MTPELVEFARLAPLGFVIGAYGTLVGAGGGSLLVPALLILMPAESPATVTSISLAVVFFNAYSGTVAYMRMGRIDYFAAVLFTLAGVPGAIVGVLLVHDVPRGLFDPLFGVLLLGIGLMLAVNPLGNGHAVAAKLAPASAPSFLPLSQGERGPRSGRAYNAYLGSVGSAYIAVLSSLLGIGGGIIHVPFLIRTLKLTPHVATATSHFVLTFMALTATMVHLVLGEFGAGLNRTMYLAVGVMMGAPLGAALSVKIRGSIIVQMLALALCFVGMRLVARVWWG
jgi:uncharacterized membrane protein YfcA